MPAIETSRRRREFYPRRPIVLDVEGRILDGRNRYAACEKAGVKPAFVNYAGKDPHGYALAVNKHRRHMRPSGKNLTLGTFPPLIERLKIQTLVRTARILIFIGSPANQFSKACCFFMEASSCLSAAIVSFVRSGVSVDIVPVIEDDTKPGYGWQFDIHDGSKFRPARPARSSSSATGRVRTKTFGRWFALPRNVGRGAFDC